MFYLGATPGQIGSKLALYGEEEKLPFLVARAGDKSGGAFVMRGRDGGGFQVNVMPEGTVLGMVRGESKSGFSIKKLGTGAVTLNTYDKNGKPVVWLKSPDRESGK